MDRLWFDKIRKVEPYVPGEQPDANNIIKLNTNECPYPPSPMAKKVLENYDTNKLRLYPSFKCNELKGILSEIYSIDENRIFLGNGSDEVIALCFQTFFCSDKPIFFPDITYSFYNVWCALYGIPYKTIPLDNYFKIKKEDYFKTNGGIVIANPNAPTGRYLELNELEEIIEHNRDVIIIIDEAYIDFGGLSAISLLDKYDNLVVVHTFSKSRALAGIRVGYAMSSKELVNHLESVKNSFNSYTLNSLSQAIATACAKDIEYYEICRRKIINTRERVIRELSEIGFDTIPSMSNFIFTTNNSVKAEFIFQELKKQNIFVRYFDKPRINEYLRISIGTDEEMNSLIKALKKLLS